MRGTDSFWIKQTKLIELSKVENALQNADLFVTPVLI